MTLLHEQHFRPVENLIHEWARAIDEDRVEAIAELMTTDGRYTVRSRFNHARGLPLAIIDAHSAAQLRDRIKSMRLANVYEPHHYRHLVTGVQIVGEQDGALAVRSNFQIVRTMELDGQVSLFCTGQYQDLVDITGAEPRFRHRLCLYDSRLVETLMVIPI
jgi:anthranilate 1,2-dioxygenase small subunit